MMPLGNDLVRGCHSPITLSYYIPVPVSLSSTHLFEAVNRCTGIITDYLCRGRRNIGPVATGIMGQGSGSWPVHSIGETERRFGLRGTCCTTIYIPFRTFRCHYAAHHAVTYFEGGPTRGNCGGPSIHLSFTLHQSWQWEQTQP